MARYMLAGVAKCSQMDNPKTGTGSGGDRCTEAVAAMIDCTYKLGPKALAGVDPQEILYDLVGMLNHGSRVSAPEALGVWLPDWLHTNGYDKSLSLVNKSIPLSFADIKANVDAGQMAIAGFNDYRELRIFDDKTPPWPWAFREQPGLGHVLLVIGYDDNFNGHGQTVIVMDPLLSLSGMPYDYSWASFGRAQLHDLTRVVGPVLPFVGVQAPPPPSSHPTPGPDLSHIKTAASDALKTLDPLSTSLAALLKVLG